MLLLAAIVMCTGWNDGRCHAATKFMFCNDESGWGFPGLLSTDDAATGSKGFLDHEYNFHILVDITVTEAWPCPPPHMS